LNIMNDFRLLKVGRDLGLLDRETTAMLTAHGKDLLTRGEREVLPGGDTASDFIRSLFTSRLTTGPLGFAPKARPINVPMQIAVQGTKNKRRIGELKGGLRRALSEDGPASEENIQITQKLLAEHQATQLRIDAEAETRVGFTFDDFISRVRKQRQFIRR